MSEDRDWSLARGKVDAEGACRAGGLVLVQGIIPCAGDLEAAHVIGRRLDNPRPGTVVLVRPARIVPLCHAHHLLYDAHELDLSPVLYRTELALAVLDVGLVSAVLRVTGGADLETVAQREPEEDTEPLIPF